MKKSILLIVFAVISIVGLVINVNGQTVYPDCYDGVVYFKIQDSAYIVIPDYSGTGTPSDYIADLVPKYNVTSLVRPYANATPSLTSITNIYRISFSNIAMVDQLIADLQIKRGNQYAEKIPIYTFFATPNDILYAANQWHLPKINADLAYDNYPASSVNKTIAILDNEIMSTHPDLQPVLLAGYDVVAKTTVTDRPAGATWCHGTHCAGIAAAVTDNTIGIASLNYRNKIKILPVKMSSASNGIPAGAPEDAIYWAANNGANVISCSWGALAAAGTNYAPLTLQVAVDYAYKVKKCIVVAAASNSNKNEYYYPASCKNVISVGATNSNDVKASFSTYNNLIDVMAPGDGIYSTVADAIQYDTKGGTSMACPLTAGLVAMMWSKNPNLSQGALEDCLKSTCTSITSIPGNMNQPWSSFMGAGRINANNALLCAGGQTIFADFTTDNNPACPNQIIKFTDLTGGTVTTRTWNFGDGTTSNLQNPSHPYLAVGTYTVTLSATGPGGTNTKTRTISIANPTAQIIGQGASNVCDNSPQLIKLNLTGTPPFTVKFKNGVIFKGLPSGAVTVIVSVKQGDSPLTIDVASDAACDAIVSGSANFTFITCCPSIFKIAGLDYGNFDDVTTIPAANTDFVSTTGSSAVGKYKIFDPTLSQVPWTWNQYTTLPSRQKSMNYDGYNSPVTLPAPPILGYTRVWCKTGVALQAATNYEIQFFTTGNNDKIINEQLAYQIRLSPSGGSAPYTWVGSPSLVPPFPGVNAADFSKVRWNQTNINYYNVTAASNMQVCICQVDLEPTLSYSNDVSIDDISMRPNIPATVNAGPDVTICAGNSISIGSPSQAGLTYTWTPATGLSSTTIANPIASPTVTTTYTLTVNNATTGCQSRDEVKITIGTTGCGCTGGRELQGSITAGITYVNTTFVINNTLTIGNGINPITVGFNGCRLIMGKDAKIIVKGPSTLTLINLTRVHACADMWDGIYIEPAARINVVGSSLVEDAVNAVVAMDGTSIYNFVAAIFNKNLVALKLPFTSALPSNSRQINNSVFTKRVLPANPTANMYTTTPSNLTALPIATLAAHTGTNNTTGVDIDNTTGFNYVGKVTASRSVYDALTYAVYSRTSDVYVKQSVFQRNDYAIFAEGSPNNTKTIEIGVGSSNNLAEANQFYDNITGVNANEYANVTVAKNNMTNTSANPVSITGVRVVSNKSTSIMVTGNTITNIQTGITVTRQGVNTSGTILLNDNILTGGPGFSLGSNAIYFADISTPFSQTYPVQISHNQIFTFTNGIETNGSQRFSTVIDGNTINLKGEQFGSGIYSSAINSLGATTIINNTIDGLVTAPNSSYIGVSGISIWYTPNCTLQCNTIKNTGQSMVFNNNCSSSKVANNNMNTAYDGIVLTNNGVIGTQGSASSASDNQWLATSPAVVPNNFIRSQMLADGSFMSPYSWYVQNISPGYNPTKNATIGIASLPSFPTASASTGCGGGGGTFAAMQSGTTSAATLSSAALDQQISASTIQYPAFANESRIINNQMVYEYLQNNPAQLKGKYKKFADSISTAPIGLISKFNTALQQQNNALAQSLNNSFTPTNTIEQNHQTINNYLVDYGINGKYQLAFAEKNKLRAIAAQCPITGGRAVFQARALYNLINGHDTIFRDVCKDKFAGAKLSGENNNVPIVLNEELGVVKIYPNPNTGQFILEYTIDEDSEAVFELYDITGKQVDVLKLNSKSTLVEINENKMENGIYYYRVLVNGAIARADKLVIIK